MARPKKRTTETPPVKSNSFIDALKFISAVTKETGQPNETHVHLQNGWVTAFNGVLAAGQKIQEDLFCAPNNQLMIEALSKCGEHLSITQLDNNRLSIKSEKFKAIVPCVDPIILQVPIPDAPLGEVTDKLKTAIEAVGVLADDKAAQVYRASVLMRSGSVVATTGTILFEFWHGIDLPTIAIPKSFVQSLSKLSKRLTKFGFSQSSITFYFEDESWLRTQLYADQWPNIEEILSHKSNPWTLPQDFYKGLDAVAPFSIDETVYFKKDLMCSHSTEKEGATYEVTGLPGGLVYSIKQLYLIKQYVKTIDFFVEGKFTYFFGDAIRGVIAGRSQ